MNEDLTNINPIKTPTESLNSLEVEKFIIAPNFQRASIESTITRFKNVGTKRFALKKNSESTFSITRTV